MWTRHDIQKNFPLIGRTPHDQQVAVVEGVLQAFLQREKRYVILESPVGSGKSAIAMSLAKYFGRSHILTPRKSLQDQYYGDFSHMAVMMKGRSSYPCVWWDNSEYDAIMGFISRGDTPPVNITGTHCGEGKCANGNKQAYERCSAIQQCPYSAAMSVATMKNHVVHNIHSFIFQAYMNDKFDRRPLMIIDEAHRLRQMLPEFLSRSIFVRGVTRDTVTPGDEADIGTWCDWMLGEDFLPKFRKSDLQDYLDAVGTLRVSGLSGFVVLPTYLDSGCRFTFKPLKSGWAGENLLFSFGDKVLLMSGTIYSKSLFCKEVGINEDEAEFIQVDSCFPLQMRPVLCKPEYLAPTSHRTKDMDRIVEVVKLVLDRMPDKKGLIHVPSYAMMDELMEAMSFHPRLVGHSSSDFQEKLKDFYESDRALVFVSPTCTEGVDFKYDRARFQIVLRVPYPNAGDKWVKARMDESFSWYNLEALTTFGQILGRVNRAPDDFGVTVLVDERFPDFLTKNRNVIQDWQYQAIKWR